MDTTPSSIGWLPSPPSADAIIDRYRDPRRLRTRAAGTPFWVGADKGGFTITPPSGNERRATFGALDACWPRIAAGDPVSSWKHLAEENSSYLSAIFDDLSEALPVPGPAAVPPAPPPDRPEPAPSDTGGSPAQADFDATKKVEELLRQLDQHPVTDGYCDAERRAHVLGRDVEQMRISLLERDHTIADLQSRERGKSVDAGPGTEVDGLRRRVAELLDEVGKATAQAAGSRVEVEEALTEADSLRAELASTQQSLAEVRQQLTQRADPNSGATLRVDLAPLRKGLASGVIDAVVAGYLVQAAEVLGPDPEKAVLRTRQALEACVKVLWEEAFGRSRQPGSSVAQLMSDLRDHPVLDLPDWHLAKNLYGRASAIVHEGGARPEVALWIWLGVLQFSQLTRAGAGTRPR